MWLQCLMEYDEAETMQMFKEEGREEGRKEGEKERQELANEIEARRKELESLKNRHNS